MIVAWVFPSAGTTFASTPASRSFAASPSDWALESLRLATCRIRNGGMPLPLATCVIGEASFWVFSSSVKTLRVHRLHPGQATPVDLPGDVVARPVQEDDARQVAELQSCLFQITTVRAYQSGEMRPGAVPHQEHPPRIAAVVPGVVVDPADRLGDVPGLLLVGDGGVEPVVDAD